MLTVLFSLFAIFLFASGKKKEALLMFCIMCYGNYGFLSILPISILGISGVDGALMFMVAATVINIFRNRDFRTQTDSLLKRQILFFALFMFLSVVNSLTHHNIPLSKVFMGSRSHFLFLSFFFLMQEPPKNVIWVLRALFYITVVHSFLYIIQFVTAFSAFGIEATFDPLTGKYRFLNFPPLAVFYMVLSFFHSDALGVKIPRWLTALFFVSQMCTLVRTVMIGTLVVFLIGLLDFNGLSRSFNKKTIISLFVVAVAAIPFYGYFSSRIHNEGDTKSEFMNVLGGGAWDMVDSGDYRDAGTLTYRTAWILERAVYMLDASILDATFGLGFYAPKDNRMAYEKYHFKLGINSEDGLPNQLTTPDNSYGNMITAFGFLGAFLFILIWIRLLVVNFKNRINNPLSGVVALFILYLFIEGYGGSRLSESSNMIIPFMITSLLYYVTEKEEEPYRITKYF